MSHRVLVVVTHLLGVGHYMRAAAIARALAAAGHAVTLVSGGRPAPLVPLGGAGLVQLPPVHVVGTAFTALRDADGAVAGPTLLERRKQALLAACAAARPDVVITELFPFGRRVLEAEFAALLDAARALDPRPVILSSVRDILVAPSQPARLAQTHERLARFYDGVLFHGDPAIAPLTASWPLDRALTPLVHATGYIDDAGPTPSPPTGEGTDEIIVSGGGSDASLGLFRAALGAAALDPARAWRVLAGGGLAAADFEALRASAPANAAVERARPDFPGLLARAAASVSQAGYNTVLDLMRARIRAVVIPFEDGHETEQRDRAGRFAARGLLTVLPADRLNAGSLAGAVREVLAMAAPAAAAIDRNGLARTVRLVETFADARETRRGTLAHVPAKWTPVRRENMRNVKRIDACSEPAGSEQAPAAPSAIRPAGEQSALWPRLDDALAAAHGEGLAVRFWWRDDDAAMPTPALDRLLALANDHAVPLAVAAIPARATPLLAARLAGEPRVFVLVHGFAHANHAPEGEKKAEFGPHRSLDALRDDAAAALAHARDIFGPLCLPVFVPPWNRIAPRLTPVLPSLGYCGLSTFRDRPARAAAQDGNDIGSNRSEIMNAIDTRESEHGVVARPLGTPAHHAPGLVQVNTHVDPVAWRNDRGLAADALASMIAAVERRRTGHADPREPIGLLTHHLVHDEATWHFCETLLARLSSNNAVTSITAVDCFVSLSVP